MTGRATRRALRRVGAIDALEQMQLELNYLRRHNQALSLFLRGAIRAYGGSPTDPRIVVAKPLLEGPRDQVVATPFDDRVVLSLEADPDTAAMDELVPPLDSVPWGLDEAIRARR